MNRLYTAIFVDKETEKVIYRMTEKNVWNKFFWEKWKLERLEKLSKLRDIPKSQIDIRDTTVYETQEEHA